MLGQRVAEIGARIAGIRQCVVAVVRQRQVARAEGAEACEPRQLVAHGEAVLHRRHDGQRTIPLGRFDLIGGGGDARHDAVLAAPHGADRVQHADGRARRPRSRCPGCAQPAARRPRRSRPRGRRAASSADRPGAARPRTGRARSATECRCGCRASAGRDAGPASRRKWRRSWDRTVADIGVTRKGPVPTRSGPVAWGMNGMSWRRWLLAGLAALPVGPVTAQDRPAAEEIGSWLLSCPRDAHTESCQLRHRSMLLPTGSGGPSAALEVIHRGGAFIPAVALRGLNTQATLGGLLALQTDIGLRFAMRPASSKRRPISVCSASRPPSVAWVLSPRRATTGMKLPPAMDHLQRRARSAATRREQHAAVAQLAGLRVGIAGAAATSCRSPPPPGDPVPSPAPAAARPALPIASAATTYLHSHATGPDLVGTGPFRVTPILQPFDPMNDTISANSLALHRGLLTLDTHIDIPWPTGPDPFWTGRAGSICRRCGAAASRPAASGLRAAGCPHRGKRGAAFERASACCRDPRHGAQRDGIGARVAVTAERSRQPSGTVCWPSCRRWRTASPWVASCRGWHASAPSARAT